MCRNFIPHPLQTVSLSLGFLLPFRVYFFWVLEVLNLFEHQSLVHLYGSFAWWNRAWKFSMQLEKNFFQIDLLLLGMEGSSHRGSSYSLWFSPNGMYLASSVADSRPMSSWILNFSFVLERVTVFSALAQYFFISLVSFTNFFLWISYCNRSKKSLIFLELRSWPNADNW